MTTAIVSVDATTSKIQVGGVDVVTLSSTDGLVVSEINGGQLAGLRNRIINGNFGVNQRSYVSGAAVGSLLYGHDRWKMAASADTYTFSTTANVTTITIPASKVLQQVIEGLNLESGTYTLSWAGTAQGKIGAGSYGASGITGVIVGGTDTTIEFGPGTVSKVQLEFGSTATVFEQRPYGMELALCQRYLPVFSVIDATGAFGIAAGVSATSGTVSFNFPVTTRVPPTSITLSSASHFYVAGALGITPTAIAFTNTPTVNSAPLVITVASGWSAGYAALFRAQSASAKITFNGCEL